ncbi:MAG: zinc ribbon domain-containing protein [Pseudomonadales bacterium]
MPRYDYHCDANGETVEVVHSINERMANWGQLCARAGIEPGDTDLSSEVRKVITLAPMANTPAGDSHLKSLGFTKLVKRDDGVYENVTRSGTESRYVKAGDSQTMPHFHKKLSD